MDVSSSLDWSPGSALLVPVNRSPVRMMRDRYRAQAGTPVLREPTAWALFVCALTAIATLALPLSVIQLIDGLVFVASGLEVAQDLALLCLLAILPAAALTSFALLVGRLVACVLPKRHQSTTTWGVLLLTVGWMCAWQFGRTVWLWIRAITQITYVVTPELRLLAVGLLALGVSLLMRRVGAVRLLNAAADRLWALRHATALLVLTAILLTTAFPPVVYWRGEQAGGAGPSQQRDRPDIFLITLDTLAASDANVCGDGPTYMPELRRFAKRGSCFGNLYASSNFTTPTISTIETAALPWSHFATQPDAKMAHGLRSQSMAKILQQAGYGTHMVTDNLLASPLHRGTHTAYDSNVLVHTTLVGNVVRDAVTMFPDTALPKLVAATASFLGALDVQTHGQQSPYESHRSYAAALNLIDEAKAGQPLFVWVHTLPPHSPYLPPASTKYRLLPKGELERWQDLLPDNIAYPAPLQPLVDKHRLRYREAIMAADAELGLFLRDLEARGRLDNAVIIVSSDHGESFEHGFLGHAGPLLHNALIKVPLVFKLPGQNTTRHIAQPVSMADLAPTILDIVGAPALPHAEGRSLRPMLNGEAISDQAVFSMTMERQSRFQAITNGHYAVIKGSSKLIWNLASGELQLFDLDVDPGEKTNLAAQQPELAAQMKSLLQERVKAAEARRPGMVTRP
ncbi:sulfatase [Paucibacter sp. DJ2R-2]|uniref:sulfatase family protein n=1 Tax=Paucibacter sp. DJ2R-2 TaxID=2893558 RepID=UPI0021E472A2|nr:sulfatase [Paucibacter sp. DJ2R-2]MCV2423109.1 sulfatase-like hydrolase/transferase [Paucibacter sp. DJ4R-1]MCV2441004.1 sulfatase-like hydrolase/transferase [Paucibacter sp. DJ2R-2]